MKHYALALLLLMASPLLSIGQTFTITASDSQHISIRFELGDFAIDSVVHEGELMHTIAAKGIVTPNEYGQPSLPTFSRFVAIPQGAKATVAVKTTRNETLSGINIAPSSLNLSHFAALMPFISAFVPCSSIP